LKGDIQIKTKNIRIYLDNCCFNRPYDDQNQLRIELETKSKLFVQNLIVDKKVDLVISYILELENSDNPFALRQTAIKDFFKYAVLNVEESNEIISVAQKIKQTGLKTKDSLHIACAIVAQCDYFLSTDDRLLKYQDNKIRIINPINFILIPKEDLNND